MSTQLMMTHPNETRTLLDLSLVAMVFFVVAVPVSAGVTDDLFDSTTAKPFWEFDDPNGNDAVTLSARPGWLQLHVNGDDEDTWSDGRGRAPFLCQQLNNSDSPLSVETYVDLATSNNGYPVLNSVGGFVIRDDKGAPFLMTLGLQHNWESGTEVILQKPGHSFKWASPGANAVYLRIERDVNGRTWTGSFKVHQSDPWIPLSTVKDSELSGKRISSNIDVGLFGKTWESGVGADAKIDFAFFRKSPDQADLPDTDTTAASTHTEERPGIAAFKTFCVSGKERTVLNEYREAELLRHSGRGCLTHMWFGGDWPGYERTHIRIYVDGERTPAIDMELGLGHGYGFADDHAPWGSSKLGKTGHPSGLYNTYKIPYGNGIRVTAQRPKDAPDGAPFWWIVRGTENLPVTIAGVPLPKNARLSLHKVEDHLAKPFEEFNLCDVPGDGAIYQVMIAGDGQRDSGDWKDISYLEAVIRAYAGSDAKPTLLSSGLEDYFLGTYYFNRGRFANSLAGLTHLDTETNTFSAYRFHDEDPMFFHKGLRLTCRCGEEIGGRKLHDPPETKFTTYTWLYQW